MIQENVDTGYRRPIRCLPAPSPSSPVPTVASAVGGSKSCACMHCPCYALRCREPRSVGFFSNPALRQPLWQPWRRTTGGLERQAEEAGERRFACSLSLSSLALCYSPLPSQKQAFGHAENKFYFAKNNYCYTP